MKVWVVYATGVQWDPPIVAGVYWTKHAANLARQQANVDCGRIPATMGAFKIVAKELPERKGRRDSAR